MSSTQAATPRRRASAVLLATILPVVILLAACSSQPVSQVRQSVGPVASPDPSAAATGPASAPVEIPPASGPPVTPSTVAGVPPKPANVTWKLASSKPAGGRQTTDTYTVTWESPDGVASGFRVYAVTRCLRDAKQYDGKPCVVKGMRIPKTALKQLGDLPATARTTDLVWLVGETGAPPYSAVLVRAYNDAGDSTFTIAWSNVVCSKCTP